MCIRKVFKISSSWSLLSILEIYEIHIFANKKGVVSLILVCNRRLWACKGPNCHVKNDISAGENELALTDGPHDRTRELTRGSVTF